MNPKKPLPNGVNSRGFNVQSITSLIVLDFLLLLVVIAILLLGYLQ